MTFVPLLSSVQKDFIRDVQTTINLFPPPRRMDYIQKVTERIQELIKSNPFDPRKVSKLLQECAFSISGLMDKDPMKRYLVRETIVGKLQIIIYRCLPKLSDQQHRNLFSSLSSNVISIDQSESLWNQYPFPLNYITNISSTCSLLGAAASQCKIDQVTWLIRHNADVNYTHTSSPTMLPALFCAATSTQMPVQAKTKMVKHLLAYRANPMVRTLSGEWWICRSIAIQHVQTSVFQLMMESVSDMSLAQGVVICNGRVLKTDVLQEFLKHYACLAHIDQIVRLANILIFHGLKIPKDLPKELNTIKHKLLTAEETHRKEYSAAQEQVQKQIVASTRFPGAVVTHIVDYFHRTIRIAVSRRCLAAIDASKSNTTDKKRKFGEFLAPPPKRRRSKRRKVSNKGHKAHKNKMSRKHSGTSTSKDTKMEEG